jgi:hypothetical protein
MPLVGLIFAIPMVGAGIGVTLGIMVAICLLGSLLGGTLGAFTLHRARTGRDVRIRLPGGLGESLAIIRKFGQKLSFTTQRLAQYDWDQLELANGGEKLRKLFNQIRTFANEGMPTGKITALNFFADVTSLKNKINQELKIARAGQAYDISLIYQARGLLAFLEELLHDFSDCPSSPSSVATGPINFLLQTLDSDMIGIAGHNDAFEARLGECLRRDRDRQNLDKALEKMFPSFTPAPHLQTSQVAESPTEKQRQHVENYIFQVVGGDNCTDSHGQVHHFSCLHSLKVDTEKAWRDTLGLELQNGATNEPDDSNWQPGWKVVEQVVAVPRLDEKGKLIKNEDGIIQRESKIFQFPVYAATLSCDVQWEKGMFRGGTWRGKITRNVVFSADSDGNFHMAFAVPAGDGKMRLTHEWKMLRPDEISEASMRSFADALWLDSSREQLERLLHPTI